MSMESPEMRAPASPSLWEGENHRLEPHRARPSGAVPAVDLLLDMDERFRRRAGRQQLPTIATRRSRRGLDRLPVLRESRDGWALTIRYSETARARELDKTRDWVVIQYSRRGVRGQATVVTEYRGPLVGTRVVRGRERECFRLRWNFARNDLSA